MRHATILWNGLDSICIRWTFLNMIDCPRIYHDSFFCEGIYLSMEGIILLVWPKSCSQSSPIVLIDSFVGSTLSAVSLDPSCGNCYF